VKDKFKVCNWLSTQEENMKFQESELISLCFKTKCLLINIFHLFEVFLLVFARLLKIDLCDGDYI